jgi:hypothetical protein
VYVSFYAGIAILKRDWVLAVELVLKPRAGEDQRVKEVCVCTSMSYWSAYVL